MERAAGHQRASRACMASAVAWENSVVVWGSYPGVGVVRDAAGLPPVVAFLRSIVVRLSYSVG